MLSRLRLLSPFFAVAVANADPFQINKYNVNLKFIYISVRVAKKENLRSVAVAAAVMTRRLIRSAVASLPASPQILKELLWL